MSARYSTSSDFYTTPNESARVFNSQLREKIDTIETIKISQNTILQEIYQKPNFQSGESPTQS